MSRTFNVQQFVTTE